MNSLGTIDFSREDRTWIVKCEPHVSLRFKRVFAGVKKGAVGELRVSATIDNARDLLWFSERYQMDIKDFPLLKKMADAYTERTSIVENLLANRSEGKKFDLAVPARDYQKIAAELLLARGGLLLADDLGLGKTASSICTLTDPRTLPAVFVTLTHLPKQMRDQIQKFAPHLSVHIAKQGTPYDMTARRVRQSGQMGFASAFPDVVILNYHKLAGWVETLGPICRSVIFDEVQELRHEGTAKYDAARFLCNAVRFRMGLSATPIFNMGGEMFNIMNCLFPGELGTYEEFSTEWCSTADKIGDPRAFSGYLRGSGMMLRRTRKEVGRELPGCTVIPHIVQTDSAELAKVEKSCDELARLILKQGEAFRGQKMQASEQLSNMLRQATGIAKAPYCAEFIRMLLESGERVAVFAWHREVWSILMDRLRSFKPAMYTGTESPTQKEAAKLAFIKGDSRVIFISLRSGAGLDGLQEVCSTAVFPELDWSPGVHEQNIGRVYRDGQKNPVQAFFLIAEGGADPAMCEVNGVKEQQMHGILNMDMELVEKLEVPADHIKTLAAKYLAQRFPENNRI